MLVSEDSANNSTEDDDQTLLRTLLCSTLKEESEKSLVFITEDCAITALQRNLDLEEENCLEYLSGYFYKRLLGFHSNKDCNNGQ